MVTVERLQKRNSEFLMCGVHQELSFREKFAVELRKNKRKKEICKKRALDGMKIRKNEGKSDVVKRIVRTVNEFEQDLRVVKSGVERLVEVFTKKSDFLEFWQNGAFELCMRLMAVGKDKEVLRVVSELFANLTVGNSVCCEEMVQMGAIQRIFEVIWESLEVAENCLWGLNNLVNGSLEICERVLLSEEFFCLVRLASDWKVVKKTKILFVFGQLVSENSAAEERTDVIIQIFLRYIDQERTVAACLIGLSNHCANNKKNLKKVCEQCPEIFEKILKTSLNEKSEIFLNTLKLLASFSFFEDFTQVLLNNKILPFLRRVLGCYSQSVKKQGFFILSNLLNSAEHNFCTVVADKDLMKKLLNSLNETNPETKFEIWVCLKILCNRTLFYYSDLFDTLIYNMHSAFNTEKDAKILMEMLETYEAILRNSGNMLQTVQTRMNESQCFDSMSLKKFHKNSDVSSKVDFIIDQYYDRYSLHGIDTYPNYL